MKISNTTYYYGQDFEKYLAMPGTSYSSLKDNPITPSAGMSLGTRVHNYLLEPEMYDWKDSGSVKAIATELRRYIGDAFQYFEKEVAFTAEFSHNGLTLPYKGRADLLKIGTMIIDLKVLGGSLDSAIARFGYHDQVSGYCLATGCTRGLILAFNKTKMRVETKLITPTQDFWEYQCVRLGMPAETVKEAALGL